MRGATKIDIAGAIIDYVAEHAAFPEMDLRQRLTVSRGYGAAEILIGRPSELLGKTIQESGLRDQDITVLTLARGGNVISNPRGTRKLRIGDRLLCFGKLDTIKAFIPQRKRRRARKLAEKVIQEALDEQPPNEA